MSDNNTTLPCDHCSTPVTAGENGQVSPPPPWDEHGPTTATCHACENRLLAEAEVRQVQESVAAAQRAGRFDCL